MKRVAREPTIEMMAAAHDRDVPWTPRAIWYVMFDAALDAAPDADCVECDGTGDASAYRNGLRVGTIEGGCGECGGSGKAPDADAGRVASDMADKAAAWDAIAEKNERIATLERDLATERGRIERALEIRVGGVSPLSAFHKMRAILRGDDDA